MFATRRSAPPGAPRRRRTAGVALALTAAIVALAAGCSSSPAAGPAPAAAGGTSTSEPAFRTIPTTAAGEVVATTSLTTAPRATAPSTSSAPTTTIATTTTTSTTVPATTAPPPVITPAQWRTFDDSLSHALLARGAIAISVAVARDGETLHTAAMGTANQFTGEAAVPSDRFRIASNSKILAAIVVMQLVHEGELSLDEPVGTRLARLLGVQLADPRAQSMTVRELLSHTSGFAAYESTFFGGLVGSCEAAAKRGLTRPLASQPGTKYVYSNMNFCLLGLLVADIEGRPYEDVVQDRVLTPLGIHDMRMAGTFDVHEGDVLHLSGAARNYMEVLGAAGAWIATADDLVKIVDSLDPDDPGYHTLDAEQAAEMRAYPRVLPIRPDQWYGLGLRVWADGTWGHTGTVENAKSMVLHRPDGLTFAVLINGNAPSNTDSIRKYVDEAFWKVGVAPILPKGAAPTTTPPASTSTQATITVEP